MLTKYVSGVGISTKVVMLVAMHLLYSGSALAELWRFSPSLTLEGRYDDNIRLRTIPHNDVAGLLLKGQLGFSRLTEVGGVTGRLHLDLSEYRGDNELNDNNENLYLTFASHHNTELNKFSILGSFKSDTTLRKFDAVDAPDEGDVDIPESDIDDGIVSVDIRRNILKISPSLEYKFTERTSLNAVLGYVDVSYQDNQVGSGLFDHDQSSLNAGITHSLNERDSFNTSLGYKFFQSPDNANNQADSYDFTLGYSRSFSEIMSGRIDVGVNYTQQESNLGNRDISGYVLRVNLKRKTEQKRFNLSFSHDLTPSGSGFITESNQLKLRMIHNFSKRLSGSVNFVYTDRDPVNSSQSKADKYFAFQPRLNWKFDRWWKLSAGYQFRSKENGNDVEKAESNAVFLSISHNKHVTFD